MIFEKEKKCVFFNIQKLYTISWYIVAIRHIFTRRYSYNNNVFASTVNVINFRNQFQIFNSPTKQ